MFLTSIELPSRLKNTLKLISPDWLELSNMIEEILEIYTSQMARIVFKLFTMVDNYADNH